MPRSTLLSLALLAALAGCVVAPPPPPPGSPQNPLPGSFPTETVDLAITAWPAAGATVGTLPPLPKPIPKTPDQSTTNAWAAVQPADLADALAALAPVAAPASKKGGRPTLRRALLQQAATSPRAARAAAAIAAAATGSDPVASSLLPDALADRPASNVGGGDGTGGAMEAAAAEKAAAATAAAAADPTIPLSSSVPAVATGPIPAALTAAMQAPPAHASPPSPHADAADAAAAAAAAARDDMDTAALPGARLFAATKPLPLLATPAPAGLGPVFAASSAAALPAADAHGSGPAARAAAVGGVEVCAVPGGKLLVLTADAVAVRDAASGALLAGPIPVSAFFQDPTGGAFTSPRCVFDGAAARSGEKRTYLAAIRTPADPDAGARPGAVAPAEPAARLVIAATVDGAAGDPTGGWVGPFSVAVDGVDRRGAGSPGGALLPASGGCPTLGCAARGLALGVDGHGLWATTELWTPDKAVPMAAGNTTTVLPPASFVGALAVGLSKAALRAGAPSRPPTLVLTDFPPWAARGLAPAVTEAWASHDARAGGTAYIAGVGGGRLGVWAVHHTAALRDGLAGRADRGGVSSPDEDEVPATSSSPPALPFVAASPFLVDHTRAAADLPPSFSAGIQRPSSLGLAAATARPHAAPGDGGPAGRTAPLDAGAPRRLARAAWADGRLWLASAAPVFAGGLSPTVGTAFFAVKPDVGSLGLRSGSTAVEATGWVAVDGAATLAPSIAAGKGGTAAVPFVLASPSFEPAFAYATVTLPGPGGADAGAAASPAVSAVKVVTAGQPSDGTTPAAALARAAKAGRSADAVGAVQAFSFAGETGAPLVTSPHTPTVAAGSGHAGALDSIAAGLFSGATASPDGEAFWVGGRRGACVSGSGCVPAWAAAVGRVVVAAEVA